MYQIIKRNGDVVGFDINKIKIAIGKAFMSLNKDVQPDIIDWLTVRSLADAERNVTDHRLSVECIQDSIEKTLSDMGYADVAKAYILYRDQHKKIRNAKNTLIDYQKVMENYLKVADWRVKENSTVSYSLGGLILGNSGAIVANYWLSEIYDKEIADAHRDVKIHLHDLSMLSAYCAGWNLKQLIEVGLTGVPGKISSKPASHLSTLCNQMVNFLGILQNEWAGAQAFSSFDTYLAPFVKVDNLTYKQVKQCIQSFVFGVNTPSRWGCQAPFSNITLDWTVPDDLKDLPAIVGGKEMDFTYGDCKKEMDMVNKAFIEVMIEGDADGRGFQYPIPTYSITPDFDWSETENNKLLFEMTAKYGIPYFSNYVNSDMKPSDIRSMCPLRGDQKVLVMDDLTREFHVSTIQNLYGGNKADKTYNIMLNGELKRAQLHRFDNLDFYKIRTVNGHEIIFSGNHQNLVLGGKIKTTDQLTTEDYLPFNTKTYADGEGLSYENGLMVGAFMGDGSLKDDYTVVYSLNGTTKTQIMTDIIQIATALFGAKINTNQVGNNCINVNITSRMLRGLIEEYISGKALDKELNTKCINRSVEFRQGIVAGLLATDGTTEKNRIYTSSEKAVETICTMLASLGIPTRITTDNRTSEDGKLSDNACYCIRMYNVSNGQPSYGDIYTKKDGFMWFRIESIEKIEGGSSIGYCFEVLDDEEPYFMLPSGLVTHNCRLRLDLRELRKKTGGFFGAGENTGSIGVVTINLPRLAYESETEKDFYAGLDHLMDIAARSLKIKREVVSKLLDAGLYPYTKAYLGGFDNHFSTIGIVGMNEAGLNAKWLRKDMTHPETQKFAINVLNHMRERLSDYQEQYGDLYNLEATPAESTTYRFAKHDKEKYPDIITANDKGTPYYTNSGHLPVGYSEDIFSALDVQDELQTLYTSGTVFHAFLGEKLPNWKSAMNLVRRIAENYRLPYYTLSPTYSVCTDHGYLVGEQPICPHCGQPTEVYSRITGYYRAVQNWNDGKQQEFKDRKTYEVATSKLIHNGPMNALPSEWNGDEDCASSATFEPEACDENGCGITAVKDSPDESTETDIVEETEKIPTLITTHTCPKCKNVKRFCDEHSIKYNEMFGDDNIDKIKELGITSAPTLLTPNGEIIEGEQAILAYFKN